MFWTAPGVITLSHFDAIPGIFNAVGLVLLSPPIISVESSSGSSGTSAREMEGAGCCDNFFDAEAPRLKVPDSQRVGGIDGLGEPVIDARSSKEA